MTDERYLSPRVLQILGVVLLVGSAVFWAFTGRESVLLVGAGMSLIGIGAYRHEVDLLRNAKEQVEEHVRERAES